MSKSLAELVTINDNRLSGTVADELFEGAPLVARMAAIPSSNGTDHHHLRYDTAPSVGFRALNDGITRTASSDTAVTVNLKILDASHVQDIQAARGYRFGVESFLERESMRELRSAFAMLEKQVINGTITTSGGDAAGFDGLADELTALSNAMVITGGGTLTLTSVYLIRDGDDSAAIVLGEDGNISIDPSVIQQTAGSTAQYGVYYTNISSWYAYQHGSAVSSAARIANIDSTGTALDDDLIADAISLFPSDRQPNMCVMNRASLKMLRQSRTATNATGAPAPFPTEVHGLPIIVTDQISSGETALS